MTATLFGAIPLAVSQGPLAAHASAACANALLDLVGRQRGEPVAALLGGEARQVHRLYASAITLMQGSARSRADQAAEWLERGVAGVKVRLGDALREEVANLRLLRRSLGDGVMLMADANEKLSTHEASWVIEVLGELGIHWLEEPVDAAAWPVLAAMRRAPMPMAFGEHLRSLEEFQDLLAGAPFDILQIDASISGGVKRALAIVDAAAREGLRLVAHNAAGPLAFAANLHLAAASGAVDLLEFPFPVVPFWRVLAPETSFADVRDGRVIAGSAPGFGVTVDRAALDRFTVDKLDIDLTVQLDDMLVPLAAAS